MPTHTHTESTMGAKNISISDEAYQRLASLKLSGESFTDVINRLTSKRSVLELAGVLQPQEADRLREFVKQIRTSSTDRVRETSMKLRRN